MSSYTDAILMCAHYEKRAIAELTLILAYNGISPPAQAGEFGVFAFDGNYLDLWYVEDAVNSIQWENPCHIQLFSRSEHDDKFTEIALHPNAVPSLSWTVYEDDKGNVLKERGERERWPSVAEEVEFLVGDKPDPHFVQFITAGRSGEAAMDRFIDWLWSGAASKLLGFIDLLLASDYKHLNRQWIVRRREQVEAKANGRPVPKFAEAQVAEAR